MKEIKYDYILEFIMAKMRKETNHSLGNITKHAHYFQTVTYKK